MLIALISLCGVCMNFVRQVLSCMLMLTFVSLNVKPMGYFYRYSELPTEEAVWRQAQEDAWQKSFNISAEEYNAAKAEFSKFENYKDSLRSSQRPNDITGWEYAITPGYSADFQPFADPGLQHFFQIYLLSRKLFSMYRLDSDTDYQALDEQVAWALPTLEVGDKSVKTAVREKNKQVREVLFQHLHQLAEPIQEPAVLFLH